MKTDHPPAALDVVADGTATGHRRINKSEMDRACDAFFRSRGMPTGIDNRTASYDRLTRNSKINRTMSRQKNSELHPLTFDPPKNQI